MLTFAEEMAAPESYLPPAPVSSRGARRTAAGVAVAAATQPADLQGKVDSVIAQLQARGFIFEPWQVAGFITAVRTKPFAILAGISGTGKTKLPRLIAEITGAESQVVPVRPDWSDSSELLGYERLDGTFQPGALLRLAQRAQSSPDRQFFLVLDEMNLARVEYYLAEVLSHIEEQHPTEDGRFISAPLLPNASASDGIEWGTVCLPSNLCLVGSVNMDETTHGFSRKVLDRSFVIEFSTVDLSVIGALTETEATAGWDTADWRVAARALAAHPQRASAEVQRIIETLIKVNQILEQGQLQFGYRVRDEITMFCLSAQQCADSFTTSSAGTVDPLDMAIAMKVLPRIQGGGGTVRRVLDDLMSWASPSQTAAADEPGEGRNVGFPFCADRIALMLRRLKESGFTNFWL